MYARPSRVHIGIYRCSNGELSTRKIKIIYRIDIYEKIRKKKSSLITDVMDAVSKYRACCLHNNTILKSVRQNRKNKKKLQKTQVYTAECTENRKQSAECYRYDINRILYLPPTNNIKHEICRRKNLSASEEDEKIKDCRIIEFFDPYAKKVYEC